MIALCVLSHVMTVQVIAFACLHIDTDPGCALSLAACAGSLQVQLM